MFILVYNFICYVFILFICVCILSYIYIISLPAEVIYYAYYVILYIMLNFKF